MNRVERLTLIPSSELRTGDVVLVHGMRVLLDGPIHNDDGTNVTDMVVYWSRGLVTNVDDLRDDFPRSWLYSATRNDDPTEPRWTVQGNDLARWNVERPVS